MFHRESKARQRFQVRLRTQLAKAVREVEMFEYDDNLVFEQENLGLQRFQMAHLRLVPSDRSSIAEYDE